MTWRENTAYIGAKFLYLKYRSNTYIRHKFYNKEIFVRTKKKYIQKTTEHSH